MRLLRERGEGFCEVYALMEKSFPQNEIRGEREARAVLSNKAYRLYRITEGGKFIGLLGVWRLSDFLFIEHFATLPDVRGMGYGSRALRALFKMYGRAVLEVEPPEDEIKRRRIAFYERCGFHLSNEEYYQPPYREGGKPVRLMLMGYPQPIENHAKVTSQLYSAVYGIKNNLYTGEIL